MLAEELRLDNDWHVRQTTSSQDLLITRLGDVDHRGLGLVGQEVGAGVVGDQSPDLVEVDGLAVFAVAVESEDANTAFSVVSRMELEHVNTAVVLTTAVSATANVLAVFADSSATVGDVSAQLSRFSQSRCH